VKWLLRFVAWSALFAVVCWWVMAPYQDLLTLAVNRLLGGRVEVETLDVKAPSELGLFAALCLAGLRAPRKARRNALLAGIPLIVIAEIVLIALGLGLSASLPQNGPAAEPALRLYLYLLRTIPWAVAIGTWLGLLGKWELPPPGPASPRGE